MGVTRNTRAAGDHPIPALRIANIHPVSHPHSTGHDHPIVFDHPNYAEALAADPHPTVTNQVGYRHSGKANVLFMDLHVQAAGPRPADLVVNFRPN